MLQLYWGQLMGVYIVGSYQDDWTLKRIGQFFEWRRPSLLQLQPSSPPLK